MADLRPIPTPFIYRWRRFVQNIVPFLIFLVGIIATMWLWERQSQMGNAIGVAEAEFVDVPSGAAGILLPPGHGEWQDFQTVKRGEVIGTVGLPQLDTFRAQIATIEKEKEKVDADMVAEREKFLHSMRLQDEGQWFDLARLYWRIEEIRLDVKDRKTRIRTAEAGLRTIRATLTFNERTRVRGATSEQQVTETRLRMQELERTIVQENEAIKTAAKNYRLEMKRLNAVEGQMASDGNERSAEIKRVVSALAQPYQKQRDVLDARTAEVQAATQSAVITAPVDGYIAEVFAVPGQSVQPGDPVVRIASGTTNYIVSYIRDRQRLYPVVTMDVKLRTRHNGSRPVASTVVQVGPQVVQIPEQHLHDTARPEWGYPIKIAMPDEYTGVLRPGEKIDIIFPTAGRKTSAPATSGGSASPEGNPADSL